MHASISAGVTTAFVVSLYTSKRKTTRVAIITCNSLYGEWFRSSETYRFVDDEHHNAVYAETFEATNDIKTTFSESRFVDFESIPWMGVE